MAWSSVHLMKVRGIAPYLCGVMFVTTEQGAAGSSGVNRAASSYSCRGTPQALRGWAKASSARASQWSRAERRHGKLASSCSQRSALGSLDRVKRVVKVLGMVNSAEGFGDQPLVVNGFSDLIVEVFGEAGRHARSAVGMAGLPGNSPVEVEMIVEFE